jgi:hypothetical protein
MRRQEPGGTRKKEGARRRNGPLAPVAFLCLLLAPSSLLPPSFYLLAQDNLPDATTFFPAVRENLARAGRMQDQFAYKERRTQVHMNPFGRIGTGGTVLYDITPNPNGPGFTRRVLERDGKPVENGEVETFGQRRRRDRAQSPSAVQDTAAVLDFAIGGRVMVEGRPAILVTFTPKPDAKPTTREGRLARAFTGKIWVDEAEAEVMRVEATAIDSITYGYGLLARLNTGTVVTLLRERIEERLWFPTSIRFQGEGRALLLRKLNIDFHIEWFDYRRQKVAPDRGLQTPGSGLRAPGLSFARPT